MPLYDYSCACGWAGEANVPIQGRDQALCPECGHRLDRLLSAPMGRIAGRVVQGGGPDRFTADVLGIPLKELPDGLKADRKD